MAALRQLARTIIPVSRKHAVFDDIIIFSDEFLRLFSPMRFHLCIFTYALAFSKNTIADAIA